MTESAEQNEDAGEVTITWNVEVGICSDMIPDTTAKDNFLKFISGELYQDNGAVENFYDKSKDAVKLKIIGKFAKVKEGVTITDGSEKKQSDAMFPQSEGFELDKTCPGFKFLQLCALYYGADADDSDSWTDVTSVAQMDKLDADKQAMDYESTATFKFVKYPLGAGIITNVSCVFGNTLTKMSLKALDGFAPQYCGGQDTIVEISMQTMDENTVSQINLLPRMAAQYMRDYRLILNCWPLRINSEMTRLLGVNEVLVEDVDITTVPGQPGLYNINMRLMAVDRTSRNREALKKLDTPTNAGSKTISSAGTVDTRNFFNLKETLAKAEIYPDLELPTITELEFYGFKFIRYTNREGFRVYPDPDFYFVYSHTLGSEIFRNTILNFTKDDANDQTEFQLSDNYAAAFNISPELKNAFIVAEGSQNEQAKNMAEQKSVIQGIIDRVVAKENAKQDADHPYKIHNDDIMNIYNSMDSYRTWDIAENIQCMFREQKFLKVIDKDDKFYADKITAKSDEIIKLIYEELNAPIQKLVDNDVTNWNKKSYIQSVNDEGDQPTKLKKAIDKEVRRMFAPENKITGRVCEILEIDMLNDKDAFGDNLEKFTNMILAAADAISGDSQYSSDDRKDWRAKMYINAGAVTLGMLGDNFDASADPNAPDTKEQSLLTPYCRIDIAEQGDSGIRFASNLAEAMEHGISFGPFQIKLFKPSEIEAIENNGEVIDTTEERLFLDPYYRYLKKDDEELKKYKRCIMMDPNIAAIAFIRNFLFYMSQLLKDGILLSLYETVTNESIEVINKNFKILSSGDINYISVDSATAKAEKSEYDKIVADQKAKKEEEQKTMTPEQIKAANKIEEEAKAAIKEQNKANAEVVKAIGNALKDGRGPLGMGKFFASIILAITAGNKNIYNLMKERNYDVLNQLVRGAQLPNSGSEYFMLTKFICALVGEKVIKSLESVGTKLDTATATLGTIINEKVYIDTNK
jgi:uncharacterized protein (UPF0297 family)